MNNTKLLNWKIFLPLAAFFFFAGFTAKAQCPVNIDFEDGTFTGWECWVGMARNNGVDNFITWSPSGPVPPDANRHLMLSSNPGDGKDYYGNFPVNCPNGSGHSVKIGNDQVNSQAEGASYTFTIPAGQNEFNLTYYYAIVVSEGAHAKYEQARMVVTAENLTDGVELPCKLDPFIVGYTPGAFTTSLIPPRNGSGSSGSVKYKDWAASSINLDGNAGKTIRIFFKTEDCTNNGHFGYAYVDVNTECTSSFIGASFCPDDAFINVTAPFGYQTYEWFNDNTLTPPAIGNTQTINFTPPPASGTSKYVKMTPFNGFGCVSILRADLNSNLVVVANAGPDKLLCNGATAQLGVIPKPGLVYKWSPVTGLSDPNISNPIANPPPGVTHYTLTVTNAGGGCLTTDEVDVTASSIDNTLTLIGNAAFCEGDLVGATLEVAPTDNIQWYMGSTLIPGATGTQYVVTQTGTYYAALSTTAGCSLNTPTRTITINPKPTPVFSPDFTTLCFYNHVFNFTNSSTIASGSNTYEWKFGDNTTGSNFNENHSYALPGTYDVKLIVTSDKGCKDSVMHQVTVNPSPDRTLTLVGSNNFCEREPGQSAVLEVQPAANIQWYRGSTAIPGANGTQYTVTQTGSYYAILSTALGCSVTTDPQVITVKATPLPQLTPNDPLTQCFVDNSFSFTNNSTVSYGSIKTLWNFGDGFTSINKDETHSYTSPGTYKIKLYVTGDEGCIDSASVDVTVNPTPDRSMTVTGDGLVICEGPGRAAILTAQPTDNIQWYRNNVAIPGATGTVYNAVTSGDYFALLSTTLGCGASTDTVSVQFNPTPKAGFDVNNPRQCDTNNSFLFTDTSKISSGTMTYLWEFGDGEISHDQSPTHTYRQGGIYHVKQTVTSDKGCVDTTGFDVVIYVSPVPDFTIKSTCMGLPLLIANKTINNTNTIINYSWDFGNGHTSTLRDPQYAYPAPGLYNIKLEVSTALCMVLLNKVEHEVYIEAPVAGITYPDVLAVTNYREQLSARQIGASYLWSPTTSLSNPKSASPVFQGVDPQLYTIQITTTRGCITVDTQYVKTEKKIQIYVPTAFTPGSSTGLNDYLRPALMGFKKLNYFKVYDRWGKLLFETRNDLPGWDGKIKGQVAELQTVIWMAEAVDIDGKVHQQKGTTILLH